MPHPAPARTGAFPAHLYLSPRRDPRYRGRDVPDDRALHLVDMENLCGGPRLIPRVGRLVEAVYRRLSEAGPMDHFVVASNPASLPAFAHTFAGARRTGFRGPDGADLALLRELEDPDWVAARYDRVVVGSGDHAFAPALESLRVRGVTVGVVALDRSLSAALAREADYARTWPETAHLGLVG